jgi:translocation and assembly module TamB
MAGATETLEAGPDPFDGPPSRSWWRWLLGLVALLLVLTAAAVPLGLWWLAETPGGRSFVARQIAGLEPESGLRFEVGRIDGSLLSSFQMLDITVHDLDGPLAVIPRAEVDWEPITLLGRIVSINRLVVPETRLFRMWNINPRNPDDPILPDIDLRLGRFEFRQIVLEKPVLGRAETLTAIGRADINSGRLLLDTQASSASGDRLLLLLDAEPDNNRFELEADLRAPVGGAVATAASLKQPLALRATGAGSWRQWRGALTADLGDAPAEGAAATIAATRIAELTLKADDGRFRVTGSLAPAPFVPESVAPLVSPGIQLDATAARPDGRFDLRFVASSPALALTGGGLLDATDNEMEGVRLDVVLKNPALVNPALSGAGITASLKADGPTKDPAIRWTVAARQLRFRGENGLMGADGLSAQGEVRLATADRPLTIPFQASAVSTTGLPPEMAALLAKPRLSGTLRFANGDLSGDNLSLTTTAMTATGSARLQASGHANASLNANLARFEIPGVGPAAIRASAAIARAPGGRPAVRGSFELRSLGLRNAAAADFLGGLPTASGKFALTPDGRIALSNGVLKSPNLSVANASGRYDPATGRFALDAAGRSRAYGPFTLVAAGTSTAPTATLRMPAPGFGFGVTDLVAEVSPAPGGLLLVASGDSPQGPLDGRIVVGMGKGQPLSLDIERAAIAGITASGRLVQTSAGPFAGLLIVDGRGLDASFALSEQGGIQRVDAKARALQARIPLPTPIGIASGSAKFSVLLVPDRPHVNGAFRFTGVSRDGVLLTDLQGSANIAGTSGVATISAKGRSKDGQPFAAVSRVQSVPTGYAVSLEGSVNKLPLKLERPAEIVRTTTGWELKPARLVLPKGQVDAAGVWAQDGELRLALRDVDLAILDLLRGGLGFGGTANGQVVIRTEPGGLIPSGEANISVTGLTRPGVTGITIPVDVRVAARSDGGGLLLGAQLAWQKNDLGRLVLKVAPGPGETPADRFLAGQLAGGVRYNGPVEPLWALGGLEGQELKGAIAVGADFAGTPANPQMSGIARGKGLIYRNAAFGTEIIDLAFDGQFGGSMLKLNSITGRANGGTLSGSGLVRVGTDPSIDLQLNLERARLANSDTLEFTLSGPLRLQGQGVGATLSGDLQVDSARVQLVQVQNSEVPQLQVRRAGEVVAPVSEPALSSSNLKLDVRVRADDRVRVEGMGLDSIWRADIRVRGTARQPQLVGTATLTRGDFSFAGSDFALSTGRVVFNGNPLDSSIDIRAQTQAEDVTAFVVISGTAAKPEVRFSSNPTLPEDEILARLLFGSSVADLSVTEAVQLATAIAGLQSGVDTMGKIRRSVGVDRLRLVGDNAETGMGTGIAIGKRLTRNIYVEVLTDSQGNTLTTMQLTLSRIWSLLIEVSSVGESSVNLRYQREY